MQVLLVFPKSNDAQCMAFADAVYRMNLSCYYATSDEDARIAYIARSHGIVIIDTRNRKLLDGLALCRSPVLFTSTVSDFLWTPAQRKRASMLCFANVFHLFIYFFYGRLILRPWLTEVRESFTPGGP